MFCPQNLGCLLKFAVTFWCTVAPMPRILKKKNFGLLLSHLFEIHAASYFQNSEITLHGFDFLYPKILIQFSYESTPKCNGMRGIKSRSMSVYFCTQKQWCA